MVSNTCKICKKGYFARRKEFCCSECKPECERYFSMIEEYLRQYPNSNAMQLSDGLGIPIDILLAFIDDGRLTISKGRFEKLS